MNYYGMAKVVNLFFPWDTFLAGENGKSTSSDFILGPLQPNLTKR